MKLRSQRECLSRAKCIKIFSEEQAPTDLSYFHQMPNGNELSSPAAVKDTATTKGNAYKRERVTARGKANDNAL